jgi:hypothetical protein
MSGSSSIDGLGVTERDGPSLFARLEQDLY